MSEILFKYIQDLETYLGWQSGTTLKAAIPVSLAALLVSWLLRDSRKRRTTRLNGPASKSYLFGLSHELFGQPDIGVVYESFEKEFGPVFAVPATMGSKTVVLCDPKAVAHFFSKDTFTYQQPPSARTFLATFFGHNLLWAEGETHKRQRRALSSAFSNAAIRRLTSVFYDSVHTLNASWEASFQASSTDSMIIEVQQCMNNISLDSIGIGGFSHDFGSLKGNKSPIADAFESFGSIKPNVITQFSFLLSPILPFLANLPTKRNKMFRALTDSVDTIADELLERARVEKAANIAESNADKSIIGTLIRSETASSSIHLTLDEIIAQNLLILAGYETTSFSLTWALIELSRNPEVQEELRKELKQFSGNDPTYDQLTTGLPYLDAAYEDDIINLTEPLQDADGQLIDSVFVAKGTLVRVPIMCLNRSELLWGADCKKFLPSRWIDDNVNKQKATELQAHHHILTFIDGPRTCLGRGFARTEFKAVLSVLIRNFSFELPDGPDTKIEEHRGILARPKVTGQEGPKVPLIVKRLESS